MLLLSSKEEVRQVRRCRFNGFFARYVGPTFLRIFSMQNTVRNGILTINKYRMFGRSKWLSFDLMLEAH